jgi:hypothetical protein
MDDYDNWDLLGNTNQQYKPIIDNTGVNASGATNVPAGGGFNSAWNAFGQTAGLALGGLLRNQFEYDRQQKNLPPIGQSGGTVYAPVRTQDGRVYDQFGRYITPVNQQQKNPLGDLIFGGGLIYGLLKLVA